MSDNGWTGFGPWPYTVLEEPDLTQHVERLSSVRAEGDTESLSFQPYPVPDKNQDRYNISQWHTPQGVWKIFSIFDGHAGHETVDYAVAHLLPILEKVILVLANSAEAAAPTTIVNVLKTTISAFDGEMTQRLFELFPGGPDAIARMSDDEIRAITVVDGHAHPVIPPCLAGTTALIALLDPSRQLYVISIGDCQAVLGVRGSECNWDTSILSAFHNARNIDEVKRLQNEHPNEPDCVSNDRVLGAIAVTRAIGDHVFKLPTIYAQRIFKIAYPSAYILPKVDGFLPRYLTPPYLSNVPEVTHVDLSQVASKDAVLILASDGLPDLQGEHGKLPISLAQRWVQVAVESNRPALSVLRDAMGGNNLEKASFWLTVEMDESWMDDTTIIVTRL